MLCDAGEQWTGLGAAGEAHQIHLSLLRLHQVQHLVLRCQGIMRSHIDKDQLPLSLGMESSELFIGCAGCQSVRDFIDVGRILVVDSCSRVLESDVDEVDGLVGWQCFGCQQSQRRTVKATAKEHCHSGWSFQSVMRRVSKIHGSPLNCLQKHACDRVRF